MFNGAHLHLILNHLPITGYCLVSLFAVIAFFKKDGRRMALMGIVVSALLTLPAFLTGEGAEEVLQKHANLMINQELIETHAMAAQWAMIAAIISGLLAAAALWLPQMNETRFRRVYPVVVIVCLWATSVMVVTGIHGGKIHHPEIAGP